MKLDFKELDVNKSSFKWHLASCKQSLKKGDIQDLSEHIAINYSLRRNS
ncbi:hypothetical protein [Helicobacter bilis]|nr:hypothetical protein [Helicobacter bilis]MCI7411792.1 hypothetical protein [Helicobacter bilis]MDD7297662.1 hypothetical protein [Helicobacter bilis]MDY4400008.1 hypothetical protein [Helicobacter bilis]